MPLSSIARISVSIFGMLLFCLLIPMRPAQAQTAPGQVDALLAPVALYPDPLLAKVLIASTYPLEVVEADRFMTANASLKGAALDSALDKQTWDENVKGLAYTPTVLKMMSEKVDWTQKLGDAFLADEKGVTDAVQRLRQKAQANGTLKTTAQQTVTVDTAQPAAQAIIIEQSEPNTVYVPYYDNSVYGPWDYGAYPPYAYPPPYGYGLAAAGIGFIAGAAIANNWGNGGFNWGNGGVYVNHRTNNFNNISGNNIGNRGRTNVANGDRWSHSADHRKGVGYGNSGLSQRYGRDSGAGAGARQDFRGRGGADRVANNLGGGNFGLGGDRGGAGGGNFGGGAGNRGGNFGGGAGGGSFGGGNRGGGFDGIGGGGASARNFSSRGSSSMRSGGFGGGGSRMASGGGARMGGGGGMRGGGGGRRR